METTGTELLIRIAGAAALLLWGARMMRTGMVRAYGANIRSFLSSGAHNRFAAAVVGALSALVLQSGTAVALLASSFGSVGVLKVTAGLAILLGADVGSAIAAQLLALNIREAWPVLMLGGYVLHASSEADRPRAKQLGRVAMGLGMIFLALTLLSTSASILQQSDIVHRVLTALGNEPVLAILLAALLTWLAHSSLVVLLLVAGLAAAGVLNHDQLAFSLMLGVNAGAAVPAVVMTLSERREGRQITLGNLLFRIFGVLVAALTLPVWTGWLSQTGFSLGQLTILSHVLFNVALLAGCILLIGPASRVLDHLVSENETVADEFAPQHLDSSATELPAVALSMASRETLRMVDCIQEMLSHAFNALESNDAKLCDRASKLDDKLDSLYEAIKLYVTELTRLELEERESRRALDIISFTTHLESAGDVIDRNLLDTVRQKIASQAEFTRRGAAEVADIQDYVCETILL
ncbi:MAG: Na/Pi cotransporter family protein, partial [Pseudomonadota bacterium]